MNLDHNNYKNDIEQCFNKSCKQMKIQFYSLRKDIHELWQGLFLN